MKLDLTGKTALVTGSSRGIGLAIAQALAGEGCHVALNGRDSAALLTASSTVPGSVHCAGDVSDPQTAHDVVASAGTQLGSLDILVCNVGSGRSVPPGQETPEAWQRAFAENLWSTTNCVEAARTALGKSRGVILCISSICGSEVIDGAPVTYSVAKASLNAYVRGISRPLAKDGVRINAIALGNMLFEGSSWQTRLDEDPTQVSAMLATEVPAGRFGTLEEVTSLTTYLVSSSASFATGAIWTLDGGQTRGSH